MDSVTKNTKRTRPARAGVKWSLEEDKELFTDLQDGKTAAEIATKLQRTEGAIKLRIIKFALQAISEGQLIDDVSSLYNLSVEDINKGLPVNKPAPKRERIYKPKKWTPRRDIILLNGIICETTHEELSKVLKTPISEVTQRLTFHALNAVERGVSKEDAALFYGIPVYTL